MNVYSTSSLLASLLCFVVSGISVYTRKTTSHIALAGTTFLVAGWSLFPYLNTVIDNSGARLIVSRILYMVAAPAPFFFLFLTYSILDTPPSRFERIGINCCKLLSLFFAALAFHPMFITSIGQNGITRYIVPGYLYITFVIYFFLTCSWSFIRMIIEYPKTKGLKRNQLKYFFGGFAIAYIGGGDSFFGGVSKV